MKDEKNERKERGSDFEKNVAPRTPKSPAPEKKGAKQPQGSGSWDVERSPYGKKLK